MKLLESTEEKTTEDKNIENVRRLENVEVVLVYYFIVILSIANVSVTHEPCLHLL